MTFAKVIWPWSPDKGLIGEVIGEQNGRVRLRFNSFHWSTYLADEITLLSDGGSAILEERSDATRIGGESAMATIQEAVKVIKNSRGKFARATFRKKDGEIRHMNFRLGVRKGVTGQGMAYNPEDRGLITVYDVQKRAYRMINVEGLIEVRAAGQTWKVDNVAA